MLIQFDIRFGSNSALTAPNSNFRSNLESRHRLLICLKFFLSGLRRHGVEYSLQRPQCFDFAAGAHRRCDRSRLEYRAFSTAVQSV
jgi:hypothetical protein